MLCTTIAAAVSQDLKIRPSSSLGGLGGPHYGNSDSTSILPESGLHAHKGTASPLELSARPDSHALEWVRPTATGASAVPLEAAQRAGYGLQEQGSGGGSERYRPEGGQRYIEYESGYNSVRRTSSAGRPALGGRADEGVSRDRDHDQGDESARLAGSTPDMTDRGRVWGSGGGGPSSGTAGFREGASGGSGCRPTERQISDEDREGLKDRSRGVMGSVTDAVGGAAAGVAHAVGLGGHHSRDERGFGSGMQVQNPGDAGYSNRAGARDQGLVVGGAGRDDLGPEVQARKEFSRVEDRPVEQERGTKYMEHRPVDKQYETSMK